MAFNDVMVRTLFDQVWWCEASSTCGPGGSLLMGVIVANGQIENLQNRSRDALRRGRAP